MLVKKLNIGNSDFKKLRTNDEYYVDKSLLIKDVIDGSDVTLLPRPRRFGKTLNMTTLRYFFEKTEDDDRGLFKGLKIARNCATRSRNIPFSAISEPIPRTSGVSSISPAISTRPTRGRNP